MMRKWIRMEREWEVGRRGMSKWRRMHLEEEVGRRRNEEVEMD